MSSRRTATWYHSPLLRLARALFALLMAFSSLLAVPALPAMAAGGSYDIKWYAADPAANRAPYLPTYAKLTPGQLTCPTPTGGVGRAADPLQHAVAYASPPTSSNRDAVTSLAPKDMALGQIVPFELEVSVSGSTAPENGVIEVTPYWLTKTTSGGNFGFDPAYGIYCAFVDTADPGTTDPGNNAKVVSFTSSTVNPGTSNEQIQGPIRISGLENGDRVIVEIWVVLKSTIPTGSTGNVQTGIVGAKTANNDTINTGNQTVPLLRVQEFFSSNADISVTKSDSPDPVLHGDQLAYTVVVRNNSTDTVANGVVVTDNLDPNTSFVSGTSATAGVSCSTSGSIVTCSVGALIPGQTVTILLTVAVLNTAPTAGTVQEGGCTVGQTGVDLCNRVSVTAITADSNTSNNSDTEPTNVIVVPNLSITKSTTTPLVNAGEQINYTITVSNSGAGAASNVMVTDALPAGSGINWTISPPVAGCSITAGVLSCSFASLASGASVSITTVSPTTAASCATYSNTASAAASNGGQVTSQPVVITVQCPALTISKTADAASVSAGDPIGFTITVSNNGAGAASNVSISDTLPSGAGLSWSISPAVAGCSITAGVLSCSVGTLAAGASFSVHISSPTTTASCATVNNTASATAGNISGSIQASAATTVNCPSLQLSKTADASPVSAGDPIGFTITVSNNGPGVARDVTLSDTLPTNGGLSWSIDAANSAVGCQISAGVLSCNFGDLASGVSKSVHITSPTTAASCGTVANTATAATSNGASPNPASAQVVVNCPDVTVAKTADNGTIDAGDTAAFTIVVSNNGPGIARNVTLSDPLPAGIAWSEDSAECSITGGTLSCAFGDLAPGASRTILVSGATDAADCGVLENTATVAAGNEAQSDTTNNSSTASISVNCASLSLSKTADAASVSAGDPIGFTITVSNSGAGTARNVTVSDTLPADAGLSWSIDAANSAAGCQISAGVLTCDFGSLAPNSSKSVHITSPTTAASCGVVGNLAAVSSSNDGGAQASASVTVNCPNVTVAKTADNGTIDAGDTAAFTIVVSNNGPGIARNVTLSDPLPAGIAWSEDSAECSITGGTLSCAFGDLAPGASRTILVSGATDAADCGVLENTATVAAGNEAQSDTSDNTSTATITVQCPDVTVLKTAESGSISAGDAAAFTIVVTNNGAGIARGVTLDDTLPAGITWSENSPVCDITAGVLSCAFGDLASGASASVTVSGVTAAANCGTLSNTALVAAGNEADADDANNSSTATIGVNCADIAIVKLADAASVSAGDPIGFTITVTNNGAGIARGVTLNDTLPTNAGLSWTIDGGADAGACQIAGGALSCDFGDLAPGASASVHITSPTTAATCGVIDNSATVSTTNDGTAQGSDQVTVNCPNVTVLKTADTSPINAGETASFTIEVSNSGSGVARSVTLADTLPAGVTWSETSAECSISGGVLSCDFGDLAPGASRTVQVSGTTGAADCGVLENTATVAATNEAQADQSDNSSTATLTVNCPDVTVRKTADTGTISAGDTASFTIEVSNNGAGIARGVTLSDTLPAGITWSETSAECSISGGVLTCNFGDLAPGASRSVTVSGTTDAADCGVLENTATVAATNEAQADQGNNSSGDSVAVNCAQIEILKTADAASVSAGDPIGFTIEVKNTGAGTARNVTLTDTLPAGAGLNWTISPAVAGCQISGGVLTCDFGDLPGNTSRTVQITSPTSAASCGVVDNTAGVTTSNDGSGESSAQVTVNCPNVTVLKTADTGTISAGDTASFTIVVANVGQGTARGVTLSDTLPAGITWSETSAECSISGSVLTCDFGDLAPGASQSVTVSGATDPDDCGVLENTATVAAQNEPAGQSDNSSTATLTVNCPDVTVRKTADTGTISAGDTASFTIEVSNSGSGVARSVTLADTLPAGITWSETSAECSISGGVLTCNFGDLAPGASRSVTVSGTTDAADCGVLENTATVAATNEAQADQGNNVSSAMITVNCPNVIVSKVADNGSVSAGDPIGFTITVTNNGQGTARSVELSDTLPAAAGLNWAITPTVAGCQLAGGALTCDFGDLTSGQSASVHITSPTSAASCGTLNNTAIVTLANGSAAPAGDEVVVNCPSLSISKTADADSVSAGDPIGFTITVANAGPGTARDVTLNDTLPAGPGINWTISPAVAGCQISGGALTCDFGDLAAGASASVHVVSATSAASCAEYPNTATAQASNNPAVSASDTTTVNCPSLSISKTADAASVSAGSPIGFTITVTNSGNGVAKDVTVSDTLPVNAGLSWSIDGGTGAAQCSIAAGSLSCSFGDMAPGASRSAHISSPTTFESCATIPNVATVSASNAAAILDDAQTVVNCPNLTISKTADAASVDAGDPLGFIITVTNAGPGSAGNVSISDTLPAGAGISWSIDAANSDSGCQIAAGVLSCNFGTLAPDAVRTVHVVSPTTAASCQLYQNTASAVADNHPTVFSGASTTVNCAEITISKTADAASVNAGEQIGFTIVVANTGAGAAKDVVITDVLPTGAGLNWSIAGGTGAAQCNIAAGTLTCTFPSLASGAQRSVSIVSPTTYASCGVVDNVAGVSTSNDGSAQAGASVTVNCPSLSVVKTADAASVDAGEQIGFTITVTNGGPGVAKDVTLSDPLPVGAGISWSISPAVAGCQITGGVLSCDFGDLAAGASKSVHIVSATSAASCGASYSNTATIGATNHPTLASSPASVTVLCANVAVVKTADAAAVDDGTPIGFTITVSSTGPGTATGVTLTDALPAVGGLSWSIDGGTGAALCGIAGGTLSCNFGSMAKDASYIVHVSSPTTTASCAVLNNTAIVAAGNEAAVAPYNQDNRSTASVTVRCPRLTIVKSATATGVAAGQPIGFAITVSNAGPGAARNVTLSDPLPGGAGINWSIVAGSVTGGATCAISGSAPAQTLNCTIASLAAGASFSVRLTSPTLYACANYPNSATAQASNHAPVSANATASTKCQHPGTIGFWRNWRNHYTASQFQILIDYLKANNPKVYNKDRVTNTADDLTIAKVDAIFNYGSATPRDQQILGQLTALKLNLAVTQRRGTSGIVQKNDNLCSNGLVNVSSISGASAYFGTTTPTVKQVVDAIEDRWTGSLTTNRNDWRFNLTNAQRDMFIRLLSGINEGTLVLTSGCP
jgi:uncharacterized repeat protein (TIGR01451 family)